MVEFTDQQIEDLLLEAKPLPDDYKELLIGSKMKKVDAHKRGEITITGEAGNKFSIKVRQNALNLLDFSVILCYEYKEKTGNFILRRYNGKSHWHTNHLEKARFRDFHIHTATERYQVAGYRVEEFAEVTSRYSDLAGALVCLIQDCNFIEPPNTQPNLL
jgi:hypothetical protein